MQFRTKHEQINISRYNWQVVYYNFSCSQSLLKLTSQQELNQSLYLMTKPSRQLLNTEKYACFPHLLKDLKNKYKPDMCIYPT